MGVLDERIGALTRNGDGVIDRLIDVDRLTNGREAEGA
jgi:hypothetical protein